MSQLFMPIKDHVKGKAIFQYYKDGNLWYKTDDIGFIFPVPIEDIGTATFHDVEKSLIMMRYIRKWLEVTNQ